MPIAGDYVEDITAMFKADAEGKGDLAVVNAARVSFDKWHDELTEGDTKLLNYLAAHQHWTPFGHPQLAFIRQGSVNYYVDWVTNSGPGFRRIIVGKNAGGYVWLERGSLYAYIRTFGHYEADIAIAMYNNYPRSMAANINREITEGQLKPTGQTVDITPSIYHEKDLTEALAANGLEVTKPMLMCLGVAHFMLRMPFPIAREWFRHQYDLVRNEVSRRYVDTEPEMYRPEYLRKRHDTAKQGSLAEPIENHKTVMNHYNTSLEYSKGVYLSLLEEGVAPEVARFVLPQAAYTMFIETGSLDSYLRLYNLRAAPDAQMEIRQYAHKLRDRLEDKWPALWETMGDQTWKPHMLTETNGGDGEMLLVDNGGETGSTVTET
jgi:thymidylate synthase (FAD)